MFEKFIAFVAVNITILIKQSMMLRKQWNIDSEIGALLIERANNFLSCFLLNEITRAKIARAVSPSESNMAFVCKITR